MQLHLLFDDLARQAAQAGSLVTVASTLVDALQVPASLTGLPTLFTTFHHFKPEVAQSILQRAVEQRQGIAIFEQARRGPLALLVMLFLPLDCLGGYPVYPPVPLVAAVLDLHHSGHYLR